MYVVVNPFGGKQLAVSILNNQARPLWEKAGIEVTVLETQYAGHSVEYARTVDFDGYDALCVCGGDGSIHEVVNGMLSRPDGRLLPLLVLPGGSGNSFAHDLLATDPLEAAQALIDGHCAWIDTNLVEDGDGLSKHSINLVSWGLVGDTGITAEACRCIGPARYDVCAVWGVFKMIMQRVSLKSSSGSRGDDRAFSGDALTMFANNTQYFGQGLRAAPAAKLDDGLMDLVVMGQVTRGEALQIFQQLPSGSHETNPKMDFQTVEKTVFRPAQREGVINLDGEICRYVSPVTITCQPKQLQVFITAGHLRLCQEKK